MKRLILCMLCIVLFISHGYLQESKNAISLDFRNQRITDILLSLSELTGETIVFDDTVDGSTTFFFADIDLETALARFADYTHLHIEKRNEMYFVSRVRIDVIDNFITIDAEEVLPDVLIRELSRKTGATIFYDALPSERITIRSANITLEQVLRLMITKNPDYQVRTENGGYYIAKNFPNNTNASNRLDIESNEGVFSISSARTNLTDIITQIFTKADKEYSLLNKSSTVLENLYYEDKTFDEMLTLVLEQASSDYQVIDGIYYIFEIQRNDVLKKLKTTIIVPLKHVVAENVLNLFPSDLNASSFTRVDRDTNTLYITGSEQQIVPIVQFIEKIDVPLEGRYYNEFSLKNIEVTDAISALPNGMLFNTPVIIPGTTSFVTQVTAEKQREIQDYLDIIDIQTYSTPIHLNYIQSEELLQYLPPSISSEQIVVTSNPSLIFYKGSLENYTNFIDDLALIDQPKKQIRYQILVIQYQKTDSFNFETGMSMEKTDASPASLISGELGSLLNVKFDIISQLGFQFAAKLNVELGENRAAILADTTLNGISGEKITFENTNTYRYRDVIINPETGVYTGETREISSGLMLDIEGWVSGDEMITVNVNTQISKQGLVSDSSGSTVANPPSTSEKTVTTSVRTKSGTPVVIGGLLQTEKDTTVKNPPLIGFVIKDQSETEATTEMIIYLVPFVEKQHNTVVESNNSIRNYYLKYIGE